MPVLLLGTMFLYNRAGHRRCGHQAATPLANPQYLNDRTPDATLARTASSGVLDIVADPLVLLNPDVSARDIRVRGVGLGQPCSRIPRKQILARAGEDVRSLDGNWFCSSNGIIHSIVIEDPRVLSRLPIRRSADVMRQFGPADSIEEAGAFGRTQVFAYISRGLVVQWNERESRIQSVTLRWTGSR